MKKEKRIKPDIKEDIENKSRITDNQEEIVDTEADIEPDNSYDCPHPDCDRTFDNKRSLNGHLLRAHRVSSKKGVGKVESPQREEVTKGEAPSYIETIKGETIDEKAEADLLAVQRRKLKLKEEVERLEERRNYLESQREEQEREGEIYETREDYQRQRFWRDESEREESINELKKVKLKTEIQNLKREEPPRTNEDYSRVKDLTEEIKGLREKLDESEKGRIEDKIEGLNKKIDEMANAKSSDAQVIASTIKDVARGYFNFLSGVTEEPPKRKRPFKDESNILNLVPDEMIE